MSRSPIRVLHLALLPAGAVRAEAKLASFWRRFVPPPANGEFDAALLVVRPRGLRTERLRGQVESLGCRLLQLPRLAPIDPTLWLRVRGVLRREAVEIVHAYDVAGCLLAMSLAPFLGFRLVASVADPPADQWRQRLAAGCERALLPGCDRVIAANRELARQLCAFGCPRRNVDVIDSGVDTQEFSRGAARDELRGALRIAPQARVVGVHVAGFAPPARRAIDEALRIVREQLGRVHLVLLGLDQARASQAATQFAGAAYTHRAPPDLPRPALYAGLSLLLVAGDGDAARQCLLEAHSMEVPAVVMGGAPLGSLLHPGACGLVEPNASPARVAAELVRWLCDPRAALQMAQAGRAQVCRQFTLSDRRARVAETYRRALQTNG